jgi:hypothetical protein
MEKIGDGGAYEILVPGKSWNLLGQGYQLTASSAVDKDGNVFFSDARRNRILKISILRARSAPGKKAATERMALRSEPMAGCTAASTTGRES